MTLDEAINQAAGELPFGWNIRVEVEKDVAWVVLLNGGERVDVHEPTKTLAERVAAAVRLAKAKKEMRGARINATTAPPFENKSLQHGVDCPKAAHHKDGHLHSEDDDGPYMVDGLVYCGRCHYWLGAA